MTETLTITDREGDSFDLAPPSGGARPDYVAVMHRSGTVGVLIDNDAARAMAEWLWRVAGVEPLEALRGELPPEWRITVSTALQGVDHTLELIGPGPGDPEAMARAALLLEGPSDLHQEVERETTAALHSLQAQLHLSEERRNVLLSWRRNAIARMDEIESQLRSANALIDAQGPQLGRLIASVGAETVDQALETINLNKATIDAVTRMLLETLGLGAGMTGHDPAAMLGEVKARYGKLLEAAEAERGRLREQIRQVFYRRDQQDAQLAALETSLRRSEAELQTAASDERRYAEREAELERRLSESLERVIELEQHLDSNTGEDVRIRLLNEQIEAQAETIREGKAERDTIRAQRLAAREGLTKARDMIEGHIGGSSTDLSPRLLLDSVNVALAASHSL